MDVSLRLLIRLAGSPGQKDVDLRKAIGIPSGGTTKFFGMGCTKQRGQTGDIQAEVLEIL
jgi:hypothetical protein